MLNHVPEALHRETIDGFSSPRSRQNWAQVSRETRRVAQQSDAAYYEKWLQQDFCRDAPNGAAPSAKEVYRQHIEASQQETSRLLRLAQSDDVPQFTAGIADLATQSKLSNRYGKLPLAGAGLDIVQRLGQPRSLNDSPPRLRAGELAALTRATSVLDVLATPQSERNQSSTFATKLCRAEQQAKQQVTQMTHPSTEAPPAPQRLRPRQRLPRR